MVYTYKNPKTGEMRDVVQSINEEHKYSDEDGLVWNRVFYAPHFSIDSTPDITTEKGFMKYTEAKKGKVGDIVELSAEASERRAEKNGGIDPVKQKSYDEYRKKTGYTHKEEKKEVIHRELKSKGIEVTF